MRSIRGQKAARRAHLSVHNALLIITPRRQVVGVSELQIIVLADVGSNVGGELVTSSAPEARRAGVVLRTESRVSHDKSSIFIVYELAIVYARAHRAAEAA